MTSADAAIADQNFVLMWAEQTRSWGSRLLRKGNAIVTFDRGAESPREGLAWRTGNQISDCCSASLSAFAFLKFRSGS
ncbi:MAG: hypothetical protein QOE34_1533 [Verrucomicrobiota bacterium]|jgi:hypothetical protein